jgi:bifunctional UDP-N-acetylglucosamine pyrophosphorylase/glucosamine-1-phosphate N-acetyltransferase
MEKSGRQKESVPLYRSVASEKQIGTAPNPFRTSTLMRLAALSQASGNKEEALSDYRAIIAVDTKGEPLAEAAMKAAQLESELGHPEEARKLFEKVASSKDSGRWQSVASLGSLRLAAQSGDNNAILKASEGAHLTLLNLYKDDPHGYGRILRKEPSQGQVLGEIQAIVEEKDASDSERQIHEIYSGVMVVPNRLLKPWLKRLQPNNAQKEYYLTDLVKLAHQDGLPIKSHITHDELEVSGINDPEQLAHMERAYQRKIARQLMHAGVRLKDPERIDIRGELRCESDVQIDVNCVFEGLVVLEQGVRIDAHCVISNAHIKAGAHIKPFTHIEGSPSGADAQGENWASVQVGEGAMVGPFARLRPGAKLSQDVHVGNFVEIKNATLAQGAKANHLAYIGDATVGERVNYGAGSITANYDGANKHHTHIEADVHVGSNCVLVAPLTLGAEGTIGAGSTITKDTPKGALTVVRAKTLSIESWKRPQKQKK